MKYCFLGKTGIQVSSLCMGTMTFGREADKAASKDIFNRCRDAGINFFDESCGIHNLNTMKMLKVSQVGITRDDVICLFLQSTGQKLVA